MLTDLVLEDSRWDAVDVVDLAEHAACATLKHLGYDGDDCDIAILACNDARIQVLNADFREKDKATNVLSWPSEERGANEDGGAPIPPMDLELGDIAIAYETCLRESEEAKIPFQDHVTHLIVHGVLHLLGYDHIRDDDATLMEGLEVSVLGKLGVPDPYRDID